MPQLWVLILIKKQQIIIKSTNLLRQFIDKSVFRQNKRPCKVWAPKLGLGKKVAMFFVIYYHLMNCKIVCLVGSK